MDSRKEVRILKEFPIPEVLCDDSILPTNIVILENSIANLEKEIARLNVKLKESNPDAWKAYEQAKQDL